MLRASSFQEAPNTEGEKQINMFAAAENKVNILSRMRLWKFVVRPVKARKTIGLNKEID